MSVRMRRRAVAAMVAGVLVLMTPGVAWSAAQGRPGTVALSFSAPVKGTALVEVERVDADAPLHTVVHDVGDDSTEDVELAPGVYRITPRAMVVDEQRYVGRSQPLQVRVKPGRVSDTTVEYVWSKGVQDLRVTDVTATSISLDWDAELGHGTRVWRVEGDDPATRHGQGTMMALDGSSLTDTDVEPGTTYSYSVFARPGDSAFGRTDGDPVTITVGTVPEEGTTGEATFVLNPRTVILAADDVAVAVPTGEGLRLALRPELPVPVPGTILSVPVSETLPGGYLGEVVDVSDDGRFVWLVAAPMAEAFDLYHLEVPDLAALEAPQPQATAQVRASSSPVADEQSRARASRADGAAASASTMTAPAAAAAAVGPECSQVQDRLNIDPSVSMSHAGHADVTIDKYKVWFVEVPSGVSFDVGYSATLQGALDIQASTAVSCGIQIQRYFRTLVTYPVPLALEAQPQIAVSVTGAGSVSDLGFAATAGFQADGYMGFTGDNSFDGDIINTSTPTQPTATGTFGLGLEIGGSVAFGPGVGTPEAGVLIGIGGELYVVDASASVKVVGDGGGTSACVELSAASRFGVYVTLSAWVGNYDLDYTVPIDPLNGTLPWGGSPWHWPDDCTEAQTPTDDVVGDGVTVIDDDVSGSSDQWGKVEGFVPGEDTWVLSTGRIQDAVGPPSFFASTELHRGGDGELTALSGFATFDAAAFTVTVVPNGQTLKVRYAFASEEYPEYVGSPYNDVMAVFIDGQNCALVPGTQVPVAVNTVNAETNAQHYVDNSTGAAGYGTTMDGLTTPLTCSAPVTPGEPVTIKIAVADASDGVYDSAVALLDGGIWSE